MSSGGDGDLNAEINVTPLVDVMLVLLIIFMITAPMMVITAVKVDLPQVSAAMIDDPKGPLVLRILPDGKLELGTTPLTWADLEAKLGANERIKKEGQLYIEADASLRYDVVITAMAIARNAKIEKVMFLTEPVTNLSQRLTELDTTKP